MKNNYKKKLLEIVNKINQLKINKILFILINKNNKIKTKKDKPKK